MDHDDERIWQQVLDGRRKWTRACQAFIAEETNRVEILRRGLCGNSTAKVVSLGLAQYLETSEQLQLFDKLVALCIPIEYATRARQIVVSLPRDWVLSNVETVVDPILQDADQSAYRMILELYMLLDRRLAMKLAGRAVAQRDEIIKEAGDSTLGSP
jgi:hypothetical protein